MTNNDARISELNTCRRLLVAEKVRLLAAGLHVEGISSCIRILMERKKEIRAQVEAARAQSAAEGK